MRGVSYAGSSCFRRDIIYICLYASSQLTAIVAHVSGEAEKTKLATVVWEGDSREALKAFREEVTQDLGFELWQLQQGERPRDYRPLPSVGPGVFELRDQDERAWYRVVYLSRIEDVIALALWVCAEPRGPASRAMDVSLSAKRS